MGQPEELLSPALAAEALGVSPATLRRYAQAWEKAFGPLPRAPGGGRLWPRAALARLKAARELAQRESLPLEEALLRVEEAPPPVVATPRPEEEALALLREVVARMEALEGEVRALREENARLREALRALEPPRRRPWWRFWG
jgi:DNA-binding transcriptional MerR regulator